MRFPSVLRLALIAFAAAFSLPSRATAQSVDVIRGRVVGEDSIPIAGARGLFIGDRLAVFLSSTDLHCGWCDSHGIEWGLDGYRKTIQWGINIIMYAMTH